MIHVVPFMVDAAPVIESLAGVAGGSKIPVLHSMMGTLPAKQDLFAAMERSGVPMFSDAEDMVVAAGMLARRREAGGNIR
jgi:acetyltransferase